MLCKWMVNVPDKWDLKGNTPLKRMKKIQSSAYYCFSIKVQTQEDYTT